MNKKLRKLPTGTIVKVEWNDACFFQDASTEKPFIRQVSVGMLYKADEHGARIAQSTTPDESDVPPCSKWSEVLSVPRGMITDVRYVDADGKWKDADFQ